MSNTPKEDYSSINLAELFEENEQVTPTNEVRSLTDAQVDELMARLDKSLERANEAQNLTQEDYEREFDVENDEEYEPDVLPVDDEESDFIAEYDPNYADDEKFCSENLSDEEVERLINQDNQ